MWNVSFWNLLICLPLCSSLASRCSCHKLPSPTTVPCCKSFDTELLLPKRSQQPPSEAGSVTNRIEHFVIHEQEHGKRLMKDLYK